MYGALIQHQCWSRVPNRYIHPRTACKTWQSLELFLMPSNLFETSESVIFGSTHSVLYKMTTVTNYRSFRSWVVYLIAHVSSLWRRLEGIGPPRIGCAKRRSWQQRENIYGFQFMTAQLPLMQIFEQSAWKSRGWTFQETIMARRLLIFTEEQVYWKCRTGS